MHNFSGKGPQPAESYQVSKLTGGGWIRTCDLQVQTPWPYPLGTCRPMTSQPVGWWAGICLRLGILVRVPPREGSASDFLSRGHLRRLSFGSISRGVQGEWWSRSLKRLAATVLRNLEARAGGSKLGFASNYKIVLLARPFRQRFVGSIYVLSCDTHQACLRGAFTFRIGFFIAVPCVLYLLVVSISVSSHSDSS